MRVRFADLALLLFAIFLALAPRSFAATPPSGTLTTGGGNLTWGGGPFTGTTSNPVAADCTNSDCDNYILTVTGTDPDTQVVNVTINWGLPTNDLDLYAFDNTTGSQIAVDGASASNTESVSFPAIPGVYRITVVIYRAVQESYTASASLGSTGAAPEPPNELRTANYQHFDFGTTPEVKLPEQERSLIYVNQDVEPEIEIDRFGSIYIGAIRGIGGGVDFWRSDDGGGSFQYLGEPDGTQNPSPIPEVPDPEGGLGGGDVDISLGDPFDLVPSVGGNPAIRSTGRIYCSSLWLGSATMSVSVDRGENWVPVPFTTAGLDRQWHVAKGEKTLYMALRKAANIEAGLHGVYVVQSDDGGVTYPKSSYVMDPLTGIPEDVGGNCVLTQDGYMVGSFTTRDRKNLYIWRNPKAPTAPPANIGPATGEVVFDPNTFDVGQVFHGTRNLMSSNRFPILAVDKANNIHVAICDRQNVYLLSCAAGNDPTKAASWTKPVPLNAPKLPGFEFTTTSIFPWIVAGDAGKVACLWYGTNMVGDPDTPMFETNGAQWKLVYAQVENALSDHPDVYLDVASKQGGGVIHTGQICARGLGCPDGTRELAEYSSLTLDNDGYANIAYTGTVINGADPTNTAAITFFTKTTKRPVRQVTWMTKAECHDARISRFGGWHDIDDARATNGRYCRNVGAHKENGGAYLQFKYNGTGVDLQIARGSRGGSAEIFIDGTTRGVVDFYRAPSDPAHPDNSGRKDLSFGEFVSFSSAPGTHMFRMEARNNSPQPDRDMLYLDGIVVMNGDLQGTGNPTETSTTSQQTAPAGTALVPGVSMQTLSVSSASTLLTGVLEMPNGADLDLEVLSPSGLLLLASRTVNPTEVTRLDPNVTGLYTFVVKNKGTTPAEYRLNMIRTTPSGGSLAGAMSKDIHAAHASTGTFDPSGSVVYTTASGGSVLIRIFTVQGRLVRSLVDQVSGAGRHITRWDGRTDDGTRVPSGVYLQRIQHPNGDLSTVKTILLR